MKTRVFWLAAALSLLAVSCTVKEPEQGGMVSDAPKLTAMTTPATRVSVVSSSGQSKTVVWNKGDDLSVFMHSAKPMKYVLEGDGGESRGVFAYDSGFLGGYEFANLYCVYPYGKNVSYEDGALKVTIPSEQTYTEKSFDPKANVMVAASQSNTLQFQNVCGYLVLRLYGEEMAVKSLTLRGFGDEALAGPATAYAYLDEDPDLALDEGSGVKAIRLTAEEPVAMGTSADAPTEFWFVVPPMTFENGFEVRIMDAEGNLARAEYTKPATIERNQIFWMDPLEALPNSVNGHAFVEMAPGLFFSTTNVGASIPEEYGDFFAWGETMPKEEYNWTNYKWTLGIQSYPSTLADSDFEKYNIFDGFMHLEAEDDAATANWGQNWHTPAQSQWKWLSDEENCTWEWTTQNDTTGYLVTSKAPGCEGNQIFLPAGGYYSGYQNGENHNSTYAYMRLSGCYWSADRGIAGSSFGFYLSTREDSHYGDSNQMRFYGQNVRPVYGTVPVSSLELDYQGEEFHLVPFQSRKMLTVSYEPAYADVYCTIEDLSVVHASIASTASKGVVRYYVFAQSEGETTLSIHAGDQVKTLKINVSLTPVEPEYVEMGPGMNWATFDVGSAAPEESGAQFQWADPEVKSDITSDDWNNYKWADPESNWSTGWKTIFKYQIEDRATDGCWYEGDEFKGDGLYLMQPEDDPATVHWGSGWRTPTHAEWQWLKNNDNCDWQRIDTDQGSAFEVTSKVPGYEGHKIVIPAASSYSGSSHWASTLYSTSRAWNESGSSGWSDGANRCSFLPIRPVYGDLIQTESISFMKESYTVMPEMYVFLNAVVEPEFVSDPTLTWTSSDPTVATVNEVGVVKALKNGTVTITVTAANGVDESCTVVVADELENSPFGKQWWWEWSEDESEGLYTFVDYVTLPNHSQIILRANSLDEVGTSFQDKDINGFDASKSFMTDDGALGIWCNDGGAFLFSDLTEASASIADIYGASFESGWFSASDNYPATVVSPQKILTYDGEPRLAIRVNGNEYPMVYPGASNIDDVEVFRSELMGGKYPVTLPLAVLKQSDGTLVYGETEDFVGKDLTGKIAVVRRGSNSFYMKADNAAAAGAVALLVVYDTNSISVNMNVSSQTANIPCFSLPLAVTDDILDQTEAEFYFTTTIFDEYL